MIKWPEAQRKDRKSSDEDRDDSQLINKKSKSKVSCQKEDKKEEVDDKDEKCERRIRIWGQLMDWR